MGAQVQALKGTQAGLTSKPSGSKLLLLLPLLTAGPLRNSHWYAACRAGQGRATQSLQFASAMAAYSRRHQHGRRPRTCRGEAVLLAVVAAVPSHFSRPTTKPSPVSSLSSFCRISSVLYCAGSRCRR